MPFEEPLTEPLDIWMARTVASYYATHDPLGVAGDFITAPEISQIFGESIGLWAIETWHKMGAPNPFVFLECGPGRGTLMADGLRAIHKIAPAFVKAMDLTLLETSLVLRDIQAKALAPYRPRWINDIADLSSDRPVITIANEFLDTLPVRQVRCINKTVWQERVVHNKTLQWRTLSSLAKSAWPVRDPVLDATYEISPVRDDFVRRLCAKKGIALLIDYGYSDLVAGGDTLQAIKKHRFVDPMTQGADITAHVNFAAISRAAHKAGATSKGPWTQGDFLKKQGAIVRAQSLIEKNPQQYFQIETALKRLISPAQMGSLFKVIEIYS